jgi:hypothetical protein
MKVRKDEGTKEQNHECRGEKFFALDRSHESAEEQSPRRNNRCITPCKAQPQLGETDEDTIQVKAGIPDCFVATLLAMTCAFGRATPPKRSCMKKFLFFIHGIKKNDTFAARNYNINMKQFSNLNSLHDFGYKALFFTGKRHVGKGAFQADCGTLTSGNGPRHFSNNNVLDTCTRVHVNTHTVVKQLRFFFAHVPVYNIHIYYNCTSIQSRSAFFEERRSDD